MVTLIKNRETKNYFSIAERDGDQRFGNWAPEFKNIMDVGHGEFRLCNILKTVAHVVVDEGSDGEPITETWKIKLIA